MPTPGVADRADFGVALFLKKVTFTEGGTEAETSDDEIVDFDAPPGESGR